MNTRIQGFKDTIKGHGAYEVISELETKGSNEVLMPLSVSSYSREI